MDEINIKIIPTENNNKHKILRKKWFNEFDTNGKGMLSFEEVETGIRNNVLNINNIFQCKNVIMRAFTEAKQLQSVASNNKDTTDKE